MDEKLIKYIMEKLDDISKSALFANEYRRERYVIKTITSDGETPKIVNREEWLELIIDILSQDLYNLSEEIYEATGILGKDG